MSIAPGLSACRALLEHDQARCGFVSLFSCRDGGSTPSVREAAQAGVLAPDNMPTMILCETRGLWLYWVVRGGIEYAGDCGAELAAHGSA